MTAKEKIDQLRAELHRHNYNYYVLNAPEISDKEFDDMMRNCRRWSENILNIRMKIRQPCA